MNNLKVVVAVLNSKYIHSSLAPWCLLAGIKKDCKNICTQVVEGTINQDINVIAEKVIAEKPQIIGFCCYIWNINQTLKAAKLIKSELANTIIVFGGPEVSYNAKDVLKENDFIDFIISGEGEEPFPALINSIHNHSKIPDNMGICGRNQKNIYISQPFISQNEPVTPYGDEYFHALSGRIAYLETSRGCPYSCAFCLSGRCGSVRYFDIDKSKENLIALANSGTQTVKLVDRTFNANKKRAIELFKFIIDNYGTALPKGICFHFEIAADILDEQTINLLKTAPCGSIQLEIGMQSFNEKTLSYINRKTDCNILINNVKALIEGGNIHIHTDLIAGLPYEDFESFKKSFNIAYELKSHMLQLGFLKLLHGAEMRENSLRYPCSFDKSPPYEVTETPWLNKSELKLLHLLEDALDRINNSGRFERTIEYIIKATGQTPFDIYLNFGKYASAFKTEKISLDRYTEIMYEFFKKYKNVSPEKLRDIMVCDRLSTNSSGILPPVLHRSDPLQKKVRLALEKNEKTKSVPKIKRGLAILYTENLVVYTDYKDKNPVNGMYKLNYIPINSLKFEN